ncbi:HEAT repeat-containing 8 [Gossypium australe]|uniref:HEAT repeat-containing 8 n=1 Tax=Gossypium australe TaxID=47621 RepID=A0A5B6VU71_9ROSI|nr:HEAT repeat-containing 8 [Gossypium australe]
MRAVGNVVGVGIANANARGVQSTSPSAEHSIIRVAAPRSASSPIAVSSEGVPSVCLTTSSANQKASWEHVDDWELSGGIVEHEVALEGSSDASGQGEPIAGVLFGGVPNLEEAKEATADLKDALDM